MPELETSPMPSATPAAEQRAPLSRRWRCGLYVLLSLVLALVFALYLQPEMMVTLSEQLWACF